MIKLQQVSGTSKKTGKKWVGYQFVIGKYKTPLVFPSEIELDYIKKELRKSGVKDFINSEDDEIAEDFGDDEDDDEDDEE